MDSTMLAVAAAMGDLKSRVCDVAEAAKQQGLPLRAKLVQSSSQSWRKGRPFIQTVDGIATVQRAVFATYEKACAALGRFPYADELDDPRARTPSGTTPRESRSCEDA